MVEKLNFIDFANKINKERLTEKGYKFYVVIDEEKYEISPVYNMDNHTLHELVLRKDWDNLFENFLLIDVINADYFIEEVNDNE